MRKSAQIIICLFLFPLALSAQDSDLGNWLIVFGNKELKNNFNWHHEVQYRNYNAIGDLEQLLLRTGIAKDVTENANLLLGYGFIRSENYLLDVNKVVINEHRIYQQFITKQKLGSLRMQHRYRFEQRFVEDDFRLRFRYFLSLNYPIWESSETAKELYLSVYDEIFLNTTQNAFDRNRLYGGLGYKLSKSLRFEFGYMNQFLNNGNRDQLNLICFIGW